MFSKEGSHWRGSNLFRCGTEIKRYRIVLLLFFKSLFYERIYHDIVFESPTNIKVLKKVESLTETVIKAVLFIILYLKKNTCEIKFVQDQNDST